MSNPNLKGNKNSGRRPIREEAMKLFNMDLANKLHNESLGLIENTPLEKRKHEDIKDFVVPMTSKAVKQVSDVIIHTPKPLDAFDDLLKPEAKPVEEPKEQ